MNNPLPLTEADLGEMLTRLRREDLCAPGCEGRCHECPNDLLRKTADALEAEQKQRIRAEQRVAKLEARLEIDHVFQIKPGSLDNGGEGELVRVEIPPEKRDELIDGISCRDEMIKLLDEDRDELAAELETAKGLLRPFAEAADACPSIQSDSRGIAGFKDNTVRITLGDLRAARAFLNPPQKAEQT